MRWIIYIVSIFLISNILVIGYWRDSQVNLTLPSILFYMVALPIIVIALTYIAGLMYKKLTQQKPDSPSMEQHSSTTERNDLVEPINESKVSGFKVYATTLQSSEGSDATEIVEALKSFKSAELDPELVAADGVSVITRRIDLDEDELITIEHILDNSMHDLEHHDASFKRTLMIYQRLIEGLSFELAHLAQGITQFNSWRIQPSVTTNALHPAWADSNIKAPSDDQIEITDIVTAMQQWPMALHVNYFIPDRLSSEQDELLNTYIANLLKELGFHADSIILNSCFCSTDDSQAQQLDTIIQQIKNTPTTVFLVLGADSSIDQDYIEEMTWMDKNYIASELGYGILLTHDQVSIPELSPVSYISDALLINPFNSNNYKLNKKYQEQTDLVLSQWLSHKKINIQEISHFISNVHPRLDYKDLPVLNNLARHFNVEAEQTVLTSALLESNIDQAIGFCWVFSIALAKNFNAAPHILCLKDQDQLLCWVTSDEPDGIINARVADKAHQNFSAQNSATAHDSTHLKLTNHAAA